MCLLHLCTVAAVVCSSIRKAGVLWVVADWRTNVGMAAYQRVFQQQQQHLQHTYWHQRNQHHHQHHHLHLRSWLSHRVCLCKSDHESDCMLWQCACGCAVRWRRPAGPGSHSGSDPTLQEGYGQGKRSFYYTIILLSLSLYRRSSYTGVFVRFLSNTCRFYGKTPVVNTRTILTLRNAYNVTIASCNISSSFSEQSRQIEHNFVLKRNNLFRSIFPKVVKGVFITCEEWLGSQERLVARGNRSVPRRDTLGSSIYILWLK